MACPWCNSICSIIECIVTMRFNPPLSWTMRWCCSFPRALLLVLLLGWWGRSSGFKICSFKLQSLNSTKAANKRVMYTLKRVGHAHTQTRIHIHMVGLFVELSSCLSLSVYLSVYLPVYLSNFISLYLSMSLPAYFSTYLSLPVCLSFCLSLFLFISTCLSAGGVSL